MNTFNNTIPSTGVILTPICIVLAGEYLPITNCQCLFKQVAAEINFLEINLYKNPQNTEPAEKSKKSPEYGTSRKKVLN